MLGARYCLLLVFLCIKFYSLHRTSGEVIQLRTEETTTCIVTVNTSTSTEPTRSQVISPFDISRQTNLSIFIHLQNNTRTTLHLANNETTPKGSKRLNTTYRWQHFVVSLENDTATVHSEDTLENIALKFIPLIIAVENADLVFWATRDYNVLTVPPCTVLCSDIDIFVDTDNSLKINLTSIKNDSEILEINFGEHFTPAKLLQQCLLKIEPNEEINLYLYKRNKHNISMGNCFLNVLHRNKMVVYRNVPSDTCNNFVTKTQTQNTLNQTCPAGNIGSSCNITCESVLGSEYLHCERHEICEGENCLCSWGWKGKFCNETCNGNTWGLSCKNNCTGCEDCNKLTGECTVGKSGHVSVGTVIAIIVAAVVILVLAGIVFLKWKNIRQRCLYIRTPSEDDQNL